MEKRNSVLILSRLEEGQWSMTFEEKDYMEVLMLQFNRGHMTTIW
jgi:hypothetical protein